MSLSCVLCDVERLSCGAFVTPDFFVFFLEGLMLPVCCALNSHAGLPWQMLSPEPSFRGSSHDASGVVPPTACGVTAVSLFFWVRPDLPCAGCAHTVTHRSQRSRLKTLFTMNPRSRQECAADGMWKSPPSLRRVQICPVLNCAHSPAFGVRLRQRLW